MEPRIQYARTSDGVNIAYWAIGGGQPLVWVPNAVASHIQMEWHEPFFRRLYDPIMAIRTLVRLDLRGMGSSDRDVASISFDTQLQDLDAVVSRLGLGAFDLMGVARGGLVAIAYAARHPQRVKRLILVDAFARGADFLAMAKIEALADLAGRDWEMYAESAGGVNFGWGRDEARRFGAIVRASLTPEIVLEYYRAASSVDLTELLPSIEVPTLVVRHGGLTNISMEMARDLTARVPNARLAVIDGNYADSDLGGVVAEFLGEGEEAPPAELPSGTAVILFADIAESTALTEKLGDAPFREKARTLDAALRGIVRDNGGTPVEGKLLGDGVLAVFTSARQSIEAALASGRAGAEAGLPLHLGLHAGDVIREENNVYGGAVNIAARISALSAPGEVLVSDTVRSLARTSAGVRFDDRGEHELKGVADPQRLYAVREENT